MTRPDQWRERPHAIRALEPTLCLLAPCSPPSIEAKRRDRSVAAFDAIQKKLSFGVGVNRQGSPFHFADSTAFAALRNKRPAEAVEKQTASKAVSAGRGGQSGVTGTMGNLLYWAVVFLIVALVAAFLGFGGVAGTAMSGAQLLFWVAIVLFAISAVVGLLRRGA